MNRRYVLGLVGALALAGVMGVRAAALKPRAAEAGGMNAAATEKLKAAKAVVLGVAVAAEKPKAAEDCCCGDCCCGDLCQAECCDSACCGVGCCDFTTSKAAAINVESCCEKDAKAAASFCPVTTAKAKAAVAR